MTSTEAKFLDKLGIHGETQDTVDLEYLKDIHWELWESVNISTRQPINHPL